MKKETDWWLYKSGEEKHPRPLDDEFIREMEDWINSCITCSETPCDCTTHHSHGDEG